MRLILGIIALLPAVLTLWCAASYLSTKPQLIETRAELNHLPATGQPLSERDVAPYVSRMRQSGSNWGYAALMAGASALAAFAGLIATKGSKENTPEP